MPVIKMVGPESYPMAKLVAKTCFLSGFFVQSFCLDSASYVKFDKTPLLSRQIEFPDILVVTTDSAEDAKDAMKHSKEKSIIILNSKEKPKFPEIKKRRLHVYNVNANEISQNILRKQMPHLPLLGALAKSYDKITLRAAKQAAGENKDNSSAIEEGFKNTK